MTVNEAGKIAAEECAQAPMRIDEKESQELIRLVLDARKVFFVGVGRVLLSLQAVCKRMAHLGINAHYVGEITEPAITSEDLLIVGSGSGESIIPREISKKAKELGAKVVWIGSNKESTIAKLADCCVRIPVGTKLGLQDELKSEQIMTSLLEQTLLLYGDALAKVIAEKKGLDIRQLWQYHANLE